MQGDRGFGASVGDSGAWLVSDSEVTDLTADQVRKPLLGSGVARPCAFDCEYAGQAVLVATDGLFDYASRSAVVNPLRGALRSRDFGPAAPALIDAARLPNGELQDDIAVVVAGRPPPSPLPPDTDAVTTLWRPVGPHELALIEASGFTAFPPRLPEQPIFYPVLNQRYAEEIARDWNVPESGMGFVTQFDVSAGFLESFEIQVVGAAHHREYWIPAERLPEFNRAISGPIEVVRQFPEPA